MYGSWPKSVLNLQKDRAIIFSTIGYHLPYVLQSKNPFVIIPLQPYFLIPLIIYWYFLYMYIIFNLVG